MLGRLKEAGLTLNEDKCEFRLPRLTSFGQEGTQTGVEPSEEKVAAIRQAGPPHNVSEARYFLVLAQFVYKFVSDLSSIAKTIQRLIHKNVEFKRGKENQVAVEKIKELITRECPSLLQFKEQDKMVLLEVAEMNVRIRTSHYFFDM